jgi:hypothetical protein
MVELGENLAFAAEAIHQVGREPFASELDGDVLLEIDGFARGSPDGAHAALPQQTGEPVGPTRSPVVRGIRNDSSSVGPGGEQVSAVIRLKRLRWRILETFRKASGFYFLFAGSERA